MVLDCGILPNKAIRPGMSQQSSQTVISFLLRCCFNARCCTTSIEALIFKLILQYYQSGISTKEVICIGTKAVILLARYSLQMTVFLSFLCLCTFAPSYFFAEKVILLPRYADTTTKWPHFYPLIKFVDENPQIQASGSTPQIIYLRHKMNTQTLKVCQMIAVWSLIAVYVTGGAANLHKTTAKSC
jgi:hypothetical protein